MRSRRLAVAAENDLLVGGRVKAVNAVADLFYGGLALQPQVAIVLLALGAYAKITAVGTAVCQIDIQVFTRFIGNCHVFLTV